MCGNSEWEKKQAVSFAGIHLFQKITDSLILVPMLPKVGVRITKDTTWQSCGKGGKKGQTINN